MRAVEVHNPRKMGLHMYFNEFDSSENPEFIEIMNECSRLLIFKTLNFNYSHFHEILHTSQLAETLWFVFQQNF